MQCSECGSAAVSTGVADDVSCFTCGHHGPHKHAGKPSLHGDSFPDADAEVSGDAEADVEVSDETEEK